MRGRAYHFDLIVVQPEEEIATHAHTDCHVCGDQTFAIETANGICRRRNDAAELFPPPPQRTEQRSFVVVGFCVKNPRVCVCINGGNAPAASACTVLIYRSVCPRIRWSLIERRKRAFLDDKLRPSIQQGPSRRRQSSTCQNNDISPSLGFLFLPLYL